MSFIRMRGAAFAAVALAATVALGQSASRDPHIGYLYPAGVRRGTTARIVVGCEDGTVAALDAGGTIVRQDKIKGAPTCIAALGGSPTGPGVLLATAKGEVKLFRITR